MKWKWHAETLETLLSLSPLPEMTYHSLLPWANSLGLITDHEKVMLRKYCERKEDGKL